ncbi:MAG TPA: hypothetical protein VL404_07790 [Candidatus Eisenbacteria bacterium]|nr:hypothetical protein [Candidatus Eisenbacteria bacterium]
MTVRIPAAAAMDKEKRDFILKKGVLGMGLPVSLLMSVSVAFQVPGYLFRLQAFNAHTFLVALALFTPIFMAGGWVWGLCAYRFRK